MVVIASIASWFPIRRCAVAMVADCRLLLDLWSDNGNEHSQLQVLIFSVIHLVHLFITKVGGNNITAIRGLSKLNILEQNCTKSYIFCLKKLTAVRLFYPKTGLLSQYSLTDINYDLSLKMNTPLNSININLSSIQIWPISFNITLISLNATPELNCNDHGLNVFLFSHLIFGFRSLIFWNRN